MNLSSLAVRRGVTFLMIYLIIVGFGLFSLSRLQLDLYPDIEFPMVAVIVNYTGASPEDIETLVTRPIEGAVSSAKGATEIHSTSKQGSSLVEVKFDWGKDMEQAETDVRRKIELIKRFLPDDAQEPIIFAFDPSLQPVVMMMITGPYPLDKLRQIAEKEVEPRLARVTGIASADTHGGLEREIHVVLDPNKVAAFGLDVNAVVGAVYRENTQVPGGSIEQGRLDFTIKTEGKYRSVEEIGDVVVGMKKGEYGPEPITLKEVARVEDTFYESRRILEVDDKPAVFMVVRKQSGANTVLAADNVMAALPGIKKATAADIDFKVVFNQADFIHQSLGNLSSTAMIGVVITFLVLLLFLKNMRSSLIVASAIPLSVIATFAVMDEAGMTLNILSMSGLALAIGMLVDNAIVVLENIFRLREEGVGGWDAAVRGAKEVGTAVTASTLTTVSVFVPILFVPGIAGVMFKDMAITICFSLTVSLIVALSFIPLSASRLLGSERAKRLLKRAREHDVFITLRERYGRTLDWTLSHRWVVGVGLLGILALTVLLAIMLPTEFVAEDDQSMLFISIETPVGNKLGETYKVFKEVEKKVKQVVKPEERRMIALDVGVGKDFAAFFSKGIHAGNIRVPLVSPDHRKRSQKELEDAVRKALSDVPGIKVTVAMPFNPMGGEGDIEVQIRGHDLDKSREIGLQLKDDLLKMPQMAAVNFSMEEKKPEVRIVFDRPKMARLGLSTAAVGSAVSAYFMGKLAGRYSEGGDEYDIIVRYAKKHRLNLDEIRSAPIVTPTGKVVPLENVAHITMDLGPVDITRLDQGRVTRLLCYLKASYKDKDGNEHRKDLGRSIAAVDKLLKSYPWPEDFSYYIGGTAEDFQTSFKYLGLALLISIFLVYMVMASQFESFRQPFIIIFTVPLAGIGVVLMFSLTGSTMDISSLVGVIMLVGIVVNNGIVMVDAANQFRQRGVGRVEAIAKAARIRMRPVLMTSLTTILAMVPLALEIGEGSAGWSGMAKAVIGGLLTATLFTLFVVPTMYTLFARKTVRPMVEEG
ncbi:MAG: efflux RND transporter permease subunit [Deltaproteobacteria bacterium]|nr:efflux RND transporter permease subunit [Deltaproteobacteria bacterium]